LSHPILDGGVRGLYGRGREHNKGTITVTMRASKRQKEPSIALIVYKLRFPVPVTAEVAGSSPIVSAILFKSCTEQPENIEVVKGHLCIFDFDSRPPGR